MKAVNFTVAVAVSTTRIAVIITTTTIIPEVLVIVNAISIKPIATATWSPPPVAFSALTIITVPFG